jgi:hypothetical protein
MLTKSKLTLTRAGESWGAQGERSHMQESVVSAEIDAGLFTLRIHQGALNSYDPQHSRPDTEARIFLTLADARTLATFLASHPDSETE